MHISSTVVAFAPHVPSTHRFLYSFTVDTSTTVVTVVLGNTVAGGVSVLGADGLGGTARAKRLEQGGIFMAVANGACGVDLRHHCPVAD